MNIKYGKLPIKRYLVSNHYHIIVDEIDDCYVSVGLTSNKPENDDNQKLRKVYESNNKIVRLKSSATIDKKNKYSKVNANFNVDIESENIAKTMGYNKKDKYIKKRK
jgi:hypothetical protein